MTELRGRACPAWTSQEDQVLRTRWVAGGYQAVREYLRQLQVYYNPAAEELAAKLG
jgi:hypothetical protein